MINTSSSEYEIGWNRTCMFLAFFGCMNFCFSYHNTNIIWKEIMAKFSIQFLNGLEDF